MMHPDYYNHFNPEKNYERTCYLASGSVERPLQSAELNEVEARSVYERTQLADSFLQNGDLISGNPVCERGKIRIPECRIYADGAVRTPAPAEFTVSENATIGLKRTERLVTFRDDPGLGDPVARSENSGMEGAARLQVSYRYVLEGYDFPVFSYRHSKASLLVRGVQSLAKLSLSAESDIVVADSVGCPDLHQALREATPGSRILVKSNQLTYIPYQITRDDISIHIAPGVTVEGSKFLGIRDGVPDEDERKRTIFNCQAERTVISGGRIGIARHDMVGTQFIAIVPLGSSAIFKDFFHFDGIAYPSGQGNYKMVGELPDVGE